jgi:hypothetical protein
MGSGIWHFMQAAPAAASSSALQTGRGWTLHHHPLYGEDACRVWLMASAAMELLGGDNSYFETNINIFL